MTAHCLGRCNSNRARIVNEWPVQCYTTRVQVKRTVNDPRLSPPMHGCPLLIALFLTGTAMAAEPSRYTYDEAPTDGFTEPIRIPVVLRAQATVLHHLLDLIRFRL